VALRPRLTTGLPLSSGASSSSTSTCAPRFFSNGLVVVASIPVYVSAVQKEYVVVLCVCQ
jgi:hypothetical protein